MSIALIKQIGNQPDLSLINPVEENYKTSYSAALNYAHGLYRVNQLSPKKEFLNWAESSGLLYFTFIDLQTYKKCDEWRFVSIGKIAWILNGGATISEDSATWFRSSYVKLADITDKAIIKQNPLTIAQKNIIIKNDVIDQLDDMMFEQTYKTQPTLASELLNKRKPNLQTVNLIKERVKSWFTEIMLFGKDEQVTEGYGHMTAKERKDYIDALKTILAQLKNYKENLRAGRSQNRAVQRGKTRADRQIKKAVKSMENVKFKKRDDKLNIKSIDPLEIVGAKGLIVYDTKKKKVRVFVAETEEGLSVKGTTIQQFNDKESVMKALRKPAQQLPSFRCPSLKRAKIMIHDNITGKLYTDISGRLNEHTILVKAFR